MGGEFESLAALALKKGSFILTLLGGLIAGL